MNLKIAEFITRMIDFFYLRPFRKIIPHDTFRYAACGAINLALDILLYYLIFHFILCAKDLDLGVVVISPHIAALGLVFPITFFNGFWLNKYVAFRSSPLQGRTQLMRYGLAVAGSLLLNYLFMKLFVNGMGIFPTPSKMITNLIVACYSYLMQKHFSFRGCNRA